MRVSRVVDEIGLRNTVFEEVEGLPGQGYCAPRGGKVFCTVVRGSDDAVYWHEGCHAFVEENREGFAFDRDAEDLVCDFFAGMKVRGSPPPCSELQDRLVESVSSYSVLSLLLGAFGCVPARFRPGVEAMVSRFPDIRGMFEAARSMRSLF